MKFDDMKINNKVEACNWLWVKKGMIEVIRGINQKFIGTDYEIDTFCHEVKEDLAYARMLRSLFIINQQDKEMILIGSVKNNESCIVFGCKCSQKMELG
jgi:hypothetical protein